jgi:hypothetical protein
MTGPFYMAAMAVTSALELGLGIRIEGFSFGMGKVFRGVAGSRKGLRTGSGGVALVV